MQLMLFDSIHQVLSAEKILKKNDLKIELQPVPRTISSSCGMCIAIEQNEIMTAEKVLFENNISIKTSLRVDL